MKRYIDADKLLSDELTHRLPAGFGELSGKRYVFVEDIENAYAIDGVAVVYCKDCKFWGITRADDIDKAHYCCRDNMWCMPIRFATDFCSYGVRKEK